MEKIEDIGKYTVTLFLFARDHREELIHFMEDAYKMNPENNVDSTSNNKYENELEFVRRLVWYSVSGETEQFEDKKAEVNFAIKYSDILNAYNSVEDNLIFIGDFIENLIKGNNYLEKYLNSSDEERENFDKVIDRLVDLGVKQFSFGSLEKALHGISHENNIETISYTDSLQLVPKMNIDVHDTLSRTAVYCAHKKQPSELDAVYYPTGKSLIRIEAERGKDNYEVVFARISDLDINVDLLPKNLEDFREFAKEVIDKYSLINEYVEKNNHNDVKKAMNNYKEAYNSLNRIVKSEKVFESDTLKGHLEDTEKSNSNLMKYLEEKMNEDESSLELNMPLEITIKR